MWNCSVDDERFLDVSSEQWLWYANMFALQEEKDFDKYVAFVEYLAAFWNPEGVKKVRHMRAQREKHNFQSDEQFEETIVTGDYKNNPLIKALQKIRQNAANTEANVRDERNSKNKKMKAPLDLDQLAKRKF